MFRTAFFDALQDDLFLFHNLVLVHGGDACQFIGDSQFFVFGLSHGVIRQDVQRLQVIKLTYKISQIKQVFVIVRNAGHHHVANPHIDILFIQIGGKLQDVLIGL